MLEDYYCTQGADDKLKKIEYRLVKTEARQGYTYIDYQPISRFRA